MLHMRIGVGLRIITVSEESQTPCQNQKTLHYMTLFVIEL